MSGEAEGLRGKRTLLSIVSCQSLRQQRVRNGKGRHGGGNTRSLASCGVEKLVRPRTASMEVPKIRPQVILLSIQAVSSIGSQYTANLPVFANSSAYPSWCRVGHTVTQDIYCVTSGKTRGKR